MCHLCGERLRTLLPHKCRIPPIPFPPVKECPIQGGMRHSKNSLDVIPQTPQKWQINLRKSRVFIQTKPLTHVSKPIVVALQNELGKKLFQLEGATAAKNRITRKMLPPSMLLFHWRLQRPQTPPGNRGQLPRKQVSRNSSAQWIAQNFSQPPRKEIFWSSLRELQGGGECLKQL